VRTDPDAPKHAGVTMMAIDMKAEGVSVNPLRGLTGDAHFNEVFFDDVFVPDEDVVGDVNKGWLVARATLGNERISIGGGSGAPTGTTPAHLIKLLDSSPETAARYVLRAGEILAEIHTIRLLNLRRATRALAGAEPGPEGNVTKLLVAESGQRLTELAFELAGTAAVTEQASQLTRSYLGNRAMTIAGGTSEITRNTIAERILGLPRDPLLK
jgi:alkylation response protein AidB-like acyl-CoA dehydrogenase